MKFYIVIKTIHLALKQEKRHFSPFPSSHNGYSIIHRTSLPRFTSKNPDVTLKKCSFWASSTTFMAPLVTIPISGWWLFNTVISPAAVLQFKRRAWPENNTSFKLQINNFTFRLIRIIRLIRNFPDPSFHVKIFFRHAVVFAFQNFFKALDGVFQLHIFSGNIAEHFGHVHGLA